MISHFAPFDQDRFMRVSQIEYNFFFMCFVGTSKMLLRALVGRLRDLEIEVREVTFPHRAFSGKQAANVLE